MIVSGWLLVCLLPFGTGVVYALSRVLGERPLRAAAVLAVVCQSASMAGLLLYLFAEDEGGWANHVVLWLRQCPFPVVEFCCSVLAAVGVVTVAFVRGGRRDENRGRD